MSDVVPSGAELVAAIDALPEGRRAQLAKQIAESGWEKPEILSSKAVAAAYEGMDEQGQSVISRQVGEVAKRSTQRAERQARQAERDAAAEAAAKEAAVAAEAPKPSKPPR